MSPMFSITPLAHCWCVCVSRSIRTFASSMRLNSRARSRSSAGPVGSRRTSPSPAATARAAAPARRIGCEMLRTKKYAISTTTTSSEAASARAGSAFSHAASTIIALRTPATRTQSVPGTFAAALRRTNPSTPRISPTPGTLRRSAAELSRVATLFPTHLSLLDRAHQEPAVGADHRCRPALGQVAQVPLAQLVEIHRQDEHADPPAGLVAHRNG